MIKKYEGRIVHTKETIRLLFRTAYYQFEMQRVAVRFLIGAALAAFGFLGAVSLAAQAVLMALGCWLVISPDFPSKCRADQTLENRKHALPTIISTFDEDGVELNGEGRMRLKYRDFKCLVKGEGYYYLFLSKDSACMIDITTLKPDRPEEFMSFISDRTGLDWQERKNPLMMNITDIRHIFKS